jgi:plastocyanin
MSRASSCLAALACGTVLTLGFAASASACDSPGKKVTIKVKLDNGQPVVDTDTVNACVGDTVQWLFTVNACVGDTVQWLFAGGSKPFKVQFMGGDSPFDWPDGSKSDPARIEATVKAGAVKDGKSTPYPYDVEVDGATLDPKIIVDP